ncbi:hypothetical protein LAZ67_16002680 [Cordylochernes scorpioides]|uniref:Reverse transcriptase Ty1/copia-type domain-containing protein n=1 Tax=Cordylochernes scorpioides TaxID=51811 RepID=A0ABY6LGZ5_9ARAC|nr:hypothetical protein LAZ67_16002680 [Cordylochernes scorpioides]
MERSQYDPCVYTFRKGKEYGILGLYVDDLIIAGTDKTFNEKLASEIRKFAPQLSQFGKVARVNPTAVQWLSLSWGHGFVEPRDTDASAVHPVIRVLHHWPDLQSWIFPVDLEDHAITISSEAKYAIYVFFVNREIRGVAGDPLVILDQTLQRL